jgi:DNA sulfur modification protein DndE
MGTDIGLRFKSARDRGGKVENIFIDGIRMKDIATSAILFDMYYDGNGDDNRNKVRLPHFRNFDIRNVVCDGAKYALFVRGLADAPIELVKLTDISITSDRALTMEEADGFTLNNVWLSFSQGPVLSVKNVRNSRFENVSVAGESNLFIKAAGERTSGIVLKKMDVSKAKKATDISAEVKPSAVVIE